MGITIEERFKILQDEYTYLMGKYLMMQADYENRLKADMLAMLEDLYKKMNLIKECEYQIYGKENRHFVGKCQDVIQEKIDALKAESEDKECMNVLLK